VDDDRTAKVRKLLEKYMGQEVTFQYARNGVSGVMAGKLDRYEAETDTFVLAISRNIKPLPQTGETFILPKSETEFFAEDVFFIQRQLETEQEAKKALEIAGAVASSLVGGPGGLQ
jgi:hypothetical protein